VQFISNFDIRASNLTLVASVVFILHMSIKISPLEWLGDRLRIIDQTLLPQQEVYMELRDYREVADAIRELKVRGAPAIGVAAAYGIVLGSLGIKAVSKSKFIKQLQDVIRAIAGTRPTARNLFMAVERMGKAARTGKSIDDIKNVLEAEAVRIHEEEIASTRKLSQLGASLIENGSTILTHCNAGPLATTGFGTALGVIIRAHEHGKKVKVFADETRPLCQGSRLTAWELQKAGVPVTLITDSMAGHFMSLGKIDCVITGADRIAANGDAANKIGTYTLAVLAKENRVPFYIAAPTTTIDITIATGKEIVIEERKAEEVTHIQGVRIAPEGVGVANPAFDVTPHKYISAIITEKGIVRKPYRTNIAQILKLKAHSHNLKVKSE
jgi:methylthioribose-1-phosphate isomerase